MSPLEDVGLLSKEERAVRLGSGRILMYLFKAPEDAAETTVLAQFATEAAPTGLVVVVARSPLPDRGQVRIGPALVLFDNGRVRSVRPGRFGDRATLDRWLAGLRLAQPDPGPPSPLP